MSIHDRTTKETKRKTENTEVREHTLKTDWTSTGKYTTWRFGLSPHGLSMKTISQHHWCVYPTKNKCKRETELVIYTCCSWSIHLIFRLIRTSHRINFQISVENLRDVPKDALIRTQTKKTSNIKNFSTSSIPAKSHLLNKHRRGYRSYARITMSTIQQVPKQHNRLSIRLYCIVKIFGQEIGNKIKFDQITPSNSKLYSIRMNRK